jgi:hypothetical protein
MSNHPAPRPPDIPQTWSEAHRDFVGHAQVYVLVNALLVAIWAVTSFGNYFWPMWPMLGWGLGLGLHAVGTYNRDYSDSDD